MVNRSPPTGLRRCPDLAFLPTLLGSQVLHAGCGKVKTGQRSVFPASCKKNWESGYSPDSGMEGIPPCPIEGIFISWYPSGMANHFGSTGPLSNFLTVVVACAVPFSS